jgi:hypothetical protein
MLALKDIQIICKFKCQLIVLTHSLSLVIFAVPNGKNNYTILARFNNAKINYHLNMFRILFMHPKSPTTPTASAYLPPVHGLFGATQQKIQIYFISLYSR